MKRGALIAIAVLSVFIMAGLAGAAEVMTPDSLSGAKVVDAKWVKDNLEKVKVYDARFKNEFVESHIPGAILATYKDNSEKTPNFNPAKDEYDLSKYPADKNTSLVLYCNGTRCWKSYKVAVLLVKAGYKNINWLREGFPAWQKAGYPTE